MTGGRTAILGGTGFIGALLARRLEKSGESIRIVSRSAARVTGGPVESAPADVSDLDSVRAAVDGCRRVYCLTMGGDGTWEGFERDFVVGARHVGRACLESGVERLVYCSSIAALYLGSGNIVTAETPADAHPERRSLYARAKILAERELAALRRDNGLPVVIVRPGVVLGRGGMIHHSGLGLWMSQLDCIGWGMGRNPLPVVLVEDVVEALVRAMLVPGLEGRALNLAGDFRPCAREYVAELRRRSRRRFWFHARPLVWLQVIEIAKWMIKAAAHRPGNVWPSWRDLRSRSLGSPVDCSWEKSVLGWQPVSERDDFFAEAIDANLASASAWDPRRMEDPQAC